jgi:hypothetical protein
MGSRLPRVAPRTVATRQARAQPPRRQS